MSAYPLKDRPKNLPMRALLLALGLAASGVTVAVPVSYSFNGTVSEFSYQGSTFNPPVGAAVFGKLTYDSAYSGTYLGGAWPKESAVLDWELSVGDQKFHQVLVNPFTQSISSFDNQLTFSDDMPGSTLGDNFFDQGLLSFLFDQNFAGVIPPELPVTAFLSGVFAFGGGQGPGNSGAGLRGTIDSISVPEPMPLALMAIGLVLSAIAARRRNRNVA